jgi:hypothetical protein
MDMKVLVVRQPWAWLIVNGHKDIENRSWRTRYRGTLLIQASASLPSKGQMEEFRGYSRQRGVELPDEFETGGVVGMAQLDDCVTRVRSRWHFKGKVGWKVSRARRLRFIPMKGRLGLFDPPEDVRKRVMQQLNPR